VQPEDTCAALLLKGTNDMVQWAAVFGGQPTAPSTDVHVVSGALELHGHAHGNSAHFTALGSLLSRCRAVACSSANPPNPVHSHKQMLWREIGPDGR